MSDWIEWHGGEQPVADEVVVEVKLRNGTVLGEDPPEFYRWTNSSTKDVCYEYDIIAYRIVSQDSELDRLRKENAALRRTLDRISRLDVSAFTAESSAYGAVFLARAALQGAKDD